MCCKGDLKALVLSRKNLSGAETEADSRKAPHGWPSCKSWHREHGGVGLGAGEVYWEYRLQTWEGAKS